MKGGRTIKKTACLEDQKNREKAINEQTHSEKEQIALLEFPLS